MATKVKPATWREVDVGGATLGVHEHGSGPAVILVGTALVSDRLLPVGTDDALADRRVVAYRRRGYGSDPGAEPPSVAADARDLIALMDALDIDRAAVVGFSYSAAVALQAAADAPERVSALIKIDPPPMQAESAARYRTSNAELLAEHEAIGAWPAADRYLWRLITRTWRNDLERVLPGAVARVRHDAETFFSRDLPALMQWTFSKQDAQRVRAPALLITSSDGPEWFADQVEELHDWLPSSERVVIDGGRHTITLTHPAQVARAIADFLAAHDAP